MIDSWCSAYTIYMSVYLQKYADQASAMLKYGEVIRMLAKHRGDFVMYDEKCRYMRQAYPCPWDQFIVEQYVLALSNHISQISTQSKLFDQNTNSRRSRPPPPPPPFGYCFQYHKGQKFLVVHLITSVIIARVFIQLLCVVPQIWNCPQYTMQIGITVILCRTIHITNIVCVEPVPLPTTPKWALITHYAIYHHVFSSNSSGG